MERDEAVTVFIISGKDFNSHAHVERDSNLMFRIYDKKHFNSHAHVERDDTSKLMPIILKISTHTLTWSVTIYDDFTHNRSSNFNSHAHVERDEQHLQE